MTFDAYDALHAGDERAMEGLKLPEGERVVTFCNRGTSGSVAAEQLRRRGYEAYSLKAGWKPGRTSSVPVRKPPRSVSFHRVS